MNSLAVHVSKPSGRVGFESHDFEERKQIAPKARRISDVSVNDIMKQRTARLDEFLNTRQWNILNLPTTLADVFEFFAACDAEPLVNT